MRELPEHAVSLLLEAVANKLFTDVFVSLEEVNFTLSRLHRVVEERAQKLAPSLAVALKGVPPHCPRPEQCDAGPRGRGVCWPG
eukprot:4012910-Alexandrium_andersonii.AAC.1